MPMTWEEVQNVFTDVENIRRKNGNGAGRPTKSGRHTITDAAGELLEVDENGQFHPFSGWADTNPDPDPQQSKRQKSQAKPNAQAAAQSATQADFMKGKSKWECNVGNIVRALDQTPEFMNLIGFDQMLCTDVLLRPIQGTDPNFKPRPLTDADAIKLQERLQWFGFRRIGKNTVHDAIERYARDHAFHPVRDYLNSLKWDGNERIRTWLSDYLGAEQNEYTEAIGRMFLIAMVARVMRPGAKVDYLPILEGDQGTFKSKACAILAGSEYFSDHLPDITGKEASQHLRGKWLIEVAELRAYNRAMVDHFKEFLVRDTERYRPPFGRKEIIEPRQCCFIGTTNKDFYLRDETGARRFWPLKTGRINLDKLERDRGQLLAEAVRLFRDGVPWWPAAQFEQQTIASEQEARFEVDEWESLIESYLDKLHLPKRTTIIAIAVHALGYETERPLMPKDKDEPMPVRGTPINQFDKPKQMRVAAILRHLEWEPKRDMRERWWQPRPKAKT